jgi:FMN phosphatase YigB (HAD superfamily)
MVRVLLFDLGNTLIDESHLLYPHVHEALETLQGFETQAQEPLLLGLVSDYPMPTREKTAQDLFQEYLTILKQSDIARFFEPFEQHITLSTQAGVTKPDRRIFELSIEHLGLTAPFAECLFITENSQHIEACRTLGMETLQFSLDGSERDFSDWSEAPLLVAKILGHDLKNNLEKALRLRLSAAYGMELIALNHQFASDKIYAQAKIWHPVPLEGENPTQVTLSANLEITLDSKGNIEALNSQQPSSDQFDEVAQYLKTLEANRQIGHHPGPLSPGETHQETIENGQKRVKRGRFSAI